MVAKLIGEEGFAAGEIFSLPEGQSWIIGRDPDEATVVIGDPQVSRAHSQVTSTPEGFLIENLSGTNPTLLNGHALLDPQILNEGDRIKVGDSILRFSAAEEGEVDLPETEEPPLEEEEPYDTIFGEPARPRETASVDLTQTGRWLVKVITGPNTGAEISLQVDRAYLIGTDTTTCDIVLHDLSVSRQHARLIVGADETVTIEDLHSRNGVLIEGQTAEGLTPLRGNTTIALGTTSFVLIDREEALETLMATTPAPVTEEAPAEEAPVEAESVAAAPHRPILSGGTFILVLVALSIIVIAVAGGLTLFRSDEVVIEDRDFNKEIHLAVADFSDVRFTFNKGTGKLFLLGHVLTPVDKSELMYNLQGLTFIDDIEDNVIVDQYIWEQYNAILSKNPNWAGVSMHAPAPGRFVISGYLIKADQLATLEDYLRLNFSYLERLENQVVVEELLMEDLRSRLIATSFAGVTPEITNGEVTLTGYIGKGKARQFEGVIGEMKRVHGVRGVRNFVVVLAEQTSVIDLTGRYNVQGFARHDDVTVNVLIDGQILTRGDSFEGMRIISIKANTIILEKNGVKYKIGYN